MGKSAVTMSLIRSRFVEEYDPTIGDFPPPRSGVMLITQRILIQLLELSMAEYSHWK